VELIKKKIPWLVKTALKIFVKWLTRELLEELREGIRVKVRIDGKDYDLVIRLADHRDINTTVLLVD